MSRLPIAVVAAALVGACATTPTAQPSAFSDDSITVGSFNFSESRILAEVYAQALDRAGYRVVRRLDVGSREVVEPALERGLLELVPEYAGSLVTFLTGRTAPRDVAKTHADLAQTLSTRGLVALDAAPAQDRNAVVVTASTAEKFHLRDVSDLARVDGDLAFGGPAECPTRPLCLEGLHEAYGLSFASFVELDEGGPVTVAALVSGQVDVALMFSSDGAIAANGFVVLRDDQRLQPAENVTPVVSDEVVRRFGPALVDVIDAVSSQLTTTDLRRMNELVSAERRSPAGVAADWLTANGFDVR